MTAWPAQIARFVLHGASIATAIVPSHTAIEGELRWSRSLLFTRVAVISFGEAAAVGPAIDYPAIEDDGPRGRSRVGDTHQEKRREDQQGNERR